MWSRRGEWVKTYAMSRLANGRSDCILPISSRIAVMVFLKASASAVPLGLGFALVLGWAVCASGDTDTAHTSLGVANMSSRSRLCKYSFSCFTAPRMRPIKPFIWPYVTFRLGMGMNRSDVTVASAKAVNMAVSIFLMIDSKAALLVIMGLYVAEMEVKIEYRMTGTPRLAYLARSTFTNQILTKSPAAG